MRKPLLTAAAALAVGGGIAVPFLAQATPVDSANSAVQRDFAAAAAEFDVPLPVLLGVSHQESLWEGHEGEHNTDGGYGLMNLTDVTSSMLAGGGAGAAGRHELAQLAADPARHTLTRAAKLVDASPAELRTDDRENIRGGAALLASYQRALTGGTSTDPADWYGAVAKYSQSTDRAGAKAFADRVFATVKKGATRTAEDGQRVTLAASPTVKADTAQLNDLKLTASTTDTECPSTVQCTFVPAASTTYQVANRPDDGMKIRYIVIHDIEGSYESAISTFQSGSSGSSANYVMKSSTGEVTQMVADKNLSFHAGNYWFNMHSVGIEHEGFASEGATWYTEAQYQATADLVKYLSAEYDIPLDRQHIIGHDNVPGPKSSLASGMHWDPGPYWDWNHFMRLLGADDPKGRSSGAVKVGEAVTITPRFRTNQQTVKVCTGAAESTCTSQTEPSNFLYVRTAPSDTAPLFADPAIHTTGTGTDRIEDWGNTISSGQQFVVADVSGDWTAIWFSGAKVWFHNPEGCNTTPAKGVTILSAKEGTTSAPVYGQAYPDASEYPSDLSPSTQAPLSMYTVPSGQAYVADTPPVSSDDFFSKASGSHPADTLITGSKTYYTVQYNHRVALLNSADVAASNQS
ncbi:N-acetylmuramoyl-L-alanine amidase [Streptomyces sp. NPDC050287]|uniref:N-acetylmuramoyl-L-alanine amidase n=1 Tax=Streptomyces sp. NPDC050287 TaxID=3365608 RepID=UPI0037AF1903